MNTKSKLFSVIVEKFDTANGRTITPQMIEDYFKGEDYYNYYAFILHDKDFDEDGNIKHSHYHIVIECTNAYAKKSILNDFARNLVYDKSTISVKAVTSLVHAIRYLTHEFEEDKYIYTRNEIYSSDKNFTINVLENGIDYKNLEIEDLDEICKYSKSLADVYKTIGLKNAKIYRNLCYDLFNHYAQKEKKKGIN